MADFVADWLSSSDAVCGLKRLFRGKAKPLVILRIHQDDRRSESSVVTEIDF